MHSSPGCFNQIIRLARVSLCKEMTSGSATYLSFDICFIYFSFPNFYQYVQLPLEHIANTKPRKGPIMRYNVNDVRRSISSIRICCFSFFLLSIGIRTTAFVYDGLWMAFNDFSWMLRTVLHSLRRACEWNKLNWSWCSAYLRAINSIEYLLMRQKVYASRRRWKQTKKKRSIWKAQWIDGKCSIDRFH